MEKTASILWRTLFVLLGLVGLVWWQGGSEPLERLEAELDFRVRALLGKDSPPDPRIKIIAFNDITVKQLGRTDLALPEWSAILEALAKRAPRVVIIDKSFALVSGDAAEFVKRVRALGTKVVVGAFRSSPSLERWRSALPPHLGLPAQEPVGDLVFFGPHELAAPAFHEAGNIEYRDENWLDAMATARTTRVPSLGLRAAQELAWSHGTLLSEGHAVPLDARGRIAVNLLSPQAFLSAERFLGAFHVLQRAQAGEPIDEIKAGDVVFILPEMHTGGSDFHKTALGRIPGGFLHAAVANSVLTRRWLTPCTSPWGPTVFLVASLAVFVTMGRTALRRWLFPTVALSSALTAATGLALFVQGGIVFPWLSSTLLLFASGAMISAHFHKFSLLLYTQVASNLKELMPTAMFQELMKNPRVLKDFGPEVQDITVMYVDIERYSLAVAGHDAVSAFEALKAKFSRMIHIVHKHGGFIDKVMGDGFIAIFGFHFDPSHGGRNQEKSDVRGDGPTPEQRAARNAVRAAMEINRTEVDFINTQLDAHCHQPGIGELPIRMGIASGSSCLGNFFVHLKIDITAIGDAMNLGKRMEDRSEPYRAMLCQTTHERIGQEFETDSSVAIHFRPIQIKHQESPSTPAWELDPFRGQGSTRVRALRAVTKDLRTQERRAVEGLEVTLGDGTVARVLDVSELGMRILCNSYFGRKSILHLSIPATGRPLCLKAEVRWGAPRTGDGRKHYLHGLRFQDPDADAVRALQAWTVDGPCP